MIDIWLGLLLHLNQPVRYLNSIQYPYACQLFGVFRDDETTCPFCHTLHSATFLASFSPKFSPKTLSHHVFFLQNMTKWKTSRTWNEAYKESNKNYDIKKDLWLLKVDLKTKVRLGGMLQRRWPPKVTSSAGATVSLGTWQWLRGVLSFCLSLIL